MQSAFVFEIGCALCVHVSVIVAATFALQRRLDDARGGCRLWTACFLSILAVIAADLSLPHRRLISFNTNLSPEMLISIMTWQGRLVWLLTLVWATGVAVSLVRRSLECIQLLRFLGHHCVLLDAESMLDRAGIHRATIRRQLAHLEIRSSSQISGPFCWQLHRPTIVLPQFLIDEDETMLRHVLIHEIEHLRTKHPMQHFLQGVCSTIFWFHPAVWMAARGADLTREFLCDEVAAIAGGKFSAYLRTLVKLAERCTVEGDANSPQGTLGFGNQNSALVRRSDRLVKLAKQTKSSTLRQPIMAMGALVVLSATIQQIWIPTNVFASNRSTWSPWPVWSAQVLHNGFDIHVRDFEQFDQRTQVHELLLQEDKD